MKINIDRRRRTRYNRDMDCPTELLGGMRYENRMDRTGDHG